MISVTVLHSDVTLERRHQHPSGAIATREMVIGLEGVEIGAKGKVCLKTCDMFSNSLYYSVWTQYLYYHCTCITTSSVHHQK